MDTLLSLRVFIAIVEQESFSAAAAQLGLSRAMVSKHLMHLEQRVNARLLNRNNRHISLTDSGRLYLEHCRHTIEALDDAEAAVSRTTANPRGVIHFSAPLWLANQQFSSLLAEYREQYPEVTFDIDISGRFVDIVDEGFDLALRASRSLSPNLIARPLITMPFHLVASPEYLQRQGVPTSPDALWYHDMLSYSLESGAQTLRLRDRDGMELRTRVRPALTANNETLLRAAALAGLGITMLPLGLIQDDLERGTLVTVLPDFPPAANPLFAVYTSRRYLASKVRTFIDFLSEKLPDMGYSDPL